MTSFSEHITVTQPQHGQIKLLDPMPELSAETIVYGSWKFPHSARCGVGVSARISHGCGPRRSRS